MRKVEKYPSPLQRAGTMPCGNNVKIVAGMKVMRMVDGKRVAEENPTVSEE